MNTFSVDRSAFKAAYRKHLFITDLTFEKIAAKKNWLILVN